MIQNLHLKWDAFVQKSEMGSFLQSWSWGEFQKKIGVPYWRLTVEREGEIKAVALVLKRPLTSGRSWLYVPYGPIFSDNDAWQEMQKQLVAKAREEGAIFVKIEPLLVGGSKILDEQEWKKSNHNIQPKDTLIMDLGKEENVLLSEMNQKTRYNIRLAKRKGVRVEFSQKEKALEEFLKLSQEVQKRTSFHYHEPDYYRAQLATLSESNNIEIALAKKAGRVLAAHVLISFGDRVTYAHGASSSRMRKMMGPQLLQWESIMRARSQGYKEYDFFGVAPEVCDDNHSWAGITRFKLGFGGKRESHLGAYDYVVSRGWYSAYKFIRYIKHATRN